MEDNFYKVDTTAIQMQQEQRVGELIALTEQKCIATPVQFLKSNLENKKIRDRSTEPDIKPLIGTMLIKIGTLSGIKNEIDFMIGQDILKMIFGTYADLTLEEICKAFELERYGSFEDKTEHFQLFNADYIAKILKKYRKWKQDMKTRHDITANNNKQLEAITASQKETILINGVQRVFDEYKSSKKLEDQTEYIFDFLVEKRKIKTGNNPDIIKYYQDKIEEATQQLKQEYVTKTSVNSVDRKRIKVDLDEIIGGFSPKIIIKAKQIILIEFFNKQIRLGNQKIFQP